MIDDYDEVDFYLYEVSNKESNESGFAVLTNDRRVGEIICFVDNSDFNQDISDFPFMQMFCSNLEEYWDKTKFWDGKYNWELIKEYSRANYLSTEGKSMVGTLMYQVAEGIQSSYGTSATSSYSKNYSKLLESIGYSTGVEQPYSFETIKKSIDNKCPLIITGASKKITKTNKFLWWSWETTTGYEGGHAFIVDGYCNMKCTATNRTNKSDVQTFTTNYVHCNLGWGGSCDGYYIDSDRNRSNSI